MKLEVSSEQPSIRAMFDRWLEMHHKKSGSISENSVPEDIIISVKISKYDLPKQTPDGSLIVPVDVVGVEYKGQ